MSGLSLKAQTSTEWYPRVEGAVATYVNHDGEEMELEVGATYDAPLTVTFVANIADTIGFNVLYEWRILQVKNNVQTLLAKRNEEMTTYTFVEGGEDVSYRVEMYITYRSREEETNTGEGEAEPITFSLRGSSVQLYNAFSPNGDGTNDLYRVKTQSLLSFRMKIFNRWGQEVVSGNQDTLPKVIEGDYTYYVCWDGTYNGRCVEDGVYFILVEAEGSDGISYVKRGDINVLTTLRKGEQQ
jgi:gliding motility-associated-like protein